MLEKQTTDQKTAADILFKGRRERQRKNMPIFICDSNYSCIFKEQRLANIANQRG